jgi:hypothetical protein
VSGEDPTKDDRPRRTLSVGGITADVEVYGNDGDQRVVLCRACGISSPPLARSQAMDWFKQHAAKVSEEHRRARTRR